MLAADSLGTDFWLAFMDNNFSSPNLSLFITGNTNTSGTVSIPGLAFSAPFSVTAGTVTTVVIPSAAEITTNEMVENKGIHVTSLAEVSVYGLNQLPASTDAFLGLPTDILGKDYVNLGHKATWSGYADELAVVGTAANTTVTITPATLTGIHPAGVPFTVLLNQGETYQLKNSSVGAELSGTLITADQPIAVYGGCQLAHIPNVSYAAGDHIVEQLTPTATWGRNFVTMPLATRTLGDTFRMVADTDGTQIRVNGALVATLNRGQFHNQIITGPAQIVATNPIMVAQYSNSTDYDRVTSDPFMMLIPPQEQFLGNYTVTTPASGFFINYINVVAPSSAVGSILRDGVPIPAGSFNPIGSSGFSGAQVAVSLGSHTLSGPQAFGVFVYGFNSADSYGYPGGLALSPIALATSLDLTPAVGGQPVGGTQTVTARVVDRFGNGLQDIRVDFTITGANPTATFAFTDASGRAVYSWTGSNDGTDFVQARAGTLTDTSQITWGRLVINPTTINMTEGGPSANYTVALNAAPTANVLVTLAPDSQVTTSASLLIFTPTDWNIPQTVVVTAVDDRTPESTHTGFISHATNSADPAFQGLAATTTAAIIDNDIPMVIITPTTPLTLLEGRTRSYTAILNYPPAADVIVNVSLDAQLQIAPTTLTFTPTDWNVPRPVVVTPVADGAIEGDHQGLITHTTTSADRVFNNLDVQPVNVNIVDGDGPRVNGTAGNDLILINFTSGKIQFTLNGKTTLLSASLTQINLQTGSGNDTVQVVNPTIPVVVQGGNGADKVLVTGLTTANVFVVGNNSVAVNGVPVSAWEVENMTINGKAGNDTFTVQEMPAFNVDVKGDAGTDLITGPPQDNLWNVAASGLGKLNGNISINGVENWTGGAANDTFVFAANKGLNGTIDGGTGQNSLDYSAWTSVITVNLQTAASAGLKVFRNITKVVGGKNAADKIIGPNQANAWNIASLSGGSVNGIAFQSMENLTGGSGDDIFFFRDAQAIKGKIDGAGGNDLLDLRGYLSKAVTINLQTKTATGLAAFANVEQFQGGSGLSDILIGPNLSNSWNLTANGAGNLAGLSFGNFESYTGGTLADTFNMAAAADWLGTLDGGPGINLLNVGTGNLDGKKFRNVEIRL